MSRMDSFGNDSSQIRSKLGPHPDYQHNLRHSETLCKNSEGKLPNGMKVKVSDSQHLQKALLIISWSPGRHVKRGNYATPIFLHQYSSDFRKVAENVLDCYVKTVLDHERQNPLQPELLPTNEKV